MGDHVICVGNEPVRLKQCQLLREICSMCMIRILIKTHFTESQCVFIFSLGLYFVCLYCFNVFVCPHPFVFPWAVESSPLQVLVLA